MSRTTPQKFEGRVARAGLAPGSPPRAMPCKPGLWQRRARRLSKRVFVALGCVGLATSLVRAEPPPAHPSDRDAELAPLVMEIESARFELRVRDGRDGREGPTIRVALGSPGQATPTGRFPLERIILSPSWRPGVLARETGARPEPASLDTPMGAVKIPFASNGVIALHGGGDRKALGKPISAGCVRATDADLLRIIAWLDERDALGGARALGSGEIHRRFQRPIELVVR